MSNSMDFEHFFGKSENATKLSFSDKIYKAVINKTYMNLFKDVYFHRLNNNNEIIETVILFKV